MLVAGAPIIPFAGKEYTYVSSRGDRFLADVAAALGETIARVRRHGFHIEREPFADGPNASKYRCGLCGDDEDDALDLAAWGIDWDAADDLRPIHRPSRRPTTVHAAASAEEKVDTLMLAIDELATVANNETARQRIRPLVLRLGIWIGLDFEAAMMGEREMRRLRQGP